MSERLLDRVGKALLHDQITLENAAHAIPADGHVRVHHEHGQVGRRASQLQRFAHATDVLRLGPVASEAGEDRMREMEDAAHALGETHVLCARQAQVDGRGIAFEQTEPLRAHAELGSKRLHPLGLRRSSDCPDRVAASLEETPDQLLGGKAGQASDEGNARLCDPVARFAPARG